MTLYLYRSVFAFAVIVLFIPGILFADEGWYDESWSKRVEILINKDNIEDDLANFPIYVNLNDLPSAFFDKVAQSCEDIRVTTNDGVTELPRAIVVCDTAAGSGEMYFLADVISSNENTSFYIYFDSEDAQEYESTHQYGEKSVWVNYSYVSHDGGATEIVGDANGIAGGGIDGGSVAGAIGSATQFDGIDDDWELSADTDVLPLGNQDRSYQFWISPESLENDPVLLEYGNASPGQMIRLQLMADGRMQWRTYSQGHFFTEPVIATSTFQLVTATYSGSDNKAEVFHDDQLVGTFTFDGDLNTQNNGYYGRRIGARFTDVSFFEGVIDEIRMRSSGIDVDELRAEFINQSDTTSFYSVIYLDTNLNFNQLIADFKNEAALVEKKSLRKKYLFDIELVALLEQGGHEAIARKLSKRMVRILGRHLDRERITQSEHDALVPLLESIIMVLTK